MSRCICPNCGYDGISVCSDSDGTFMDCYKCGYQYRTEVVEEIMDKETYKSWYEDWLTEEDFPEEYNHTQKVLKTLSDKPKTFESKSKKIDGVWYDYKVIDGKKTPLVKR